MKKNLLTFTLMISSLMSLHGQGILNKKANVPDNENNCFRFFDPNAKGRNDVNAYLLSYLTRIIYPQYLNEFGYNIQATDTILFKEKYKERTKHFFYDSDINFSSIKNLKTELPTKNVLSNLGKSNPNSSTVEYEWVWRSDGVGKDPEAMVISTNSTIFVIFRGTDRVVGANSFNKAWGEWIFTDGKFFPQKPCNTCYVRVHKGFYDNLNYAGFRTHLVNTINKFGGKSKKIWITGHSLGGGLAQLFGYLLKKIDNIEADGIYVYNSPHPGDTDFASEMNQIFSEGRVQRFEFLDDPISKLPPRTIPGGWGRAGIRNYFEKETLGGYKYKTQEISVPADATFLTIFGGPVLGGMCFHHPTWITRGLFNLIPENIKSKLPNPPARVSASNDGCNEIDINHGVSGKLFDGGTDIISEGIYRIKNLKSERYLQATTNGVFLSPNCNELNQTSSTSGDATKWRISKVDGAIFESYIFQTTVNSLNNRVIDADYLNTKLDNNTDFCKVQLCNRLLPPDRRNQEWSLERLPNGNFRIKCIKDGGYLSIADCYSQDGCRYELKKSPQGLQSEWSLIKIN